MILYASNINISHLIALQDIMIPSLSHLSKLVIAIFMSQATRGVMFQCRGWTGCSAEAGTGDSSERTLYTPLQFSRDENRSNKHDKLKHSIDIACVHWVSKQLLFIHHNSLDYVYSLCRVDAMCCIDKGRKILTAIIGSSEKFFGR